MQSIHNQEAARKAGFASSAWVEPARSESSSSPVPGRSSGLLRAFAAVLILLAAAPADVRAEESATTTELETVVVVGSRAPEPLQQVVGSVSVVERQELDRAGVADLTDLERLVPGLAVPVDSVRFGRLGYNLRGLEGNRVSIEVDGVPLPDDFAVGQFALAGRDLADLSAIERVEVLRGPASTLYGSKALAGVIAYTTRDAADWLAGGDGLAFGGRGGYLSRDTSHLLAGHVAGASGPWSAMLLASRREGHETENHPPAGGMAANPAEVRNDGVLAKLRYAGGSRGEWTFTFDHGRGRQQTEVRSLVHGPGRYATTTALDGDDSWARDRLSLAASWSRPAAWLDALDLLVYHQDASTTQDTDQYRDPDAATPWPTRRLRRFEIRQQSLGVKLVGQSRTDWAGLAHWHVFGLDLTRHDYTGRRDGREINLDTGVGKPVILGERFPLRDFPNSRVLEAGVFWQDEIRLGGGWALVPGLRGERYRMEARPDALWLASFPDTRITDIATTRWTPKLGLRWSPGARSTFYLQAVSGYRAPPFSDVNLGLFLPTLNYEVRPNPELRPETSVGLEAGWRFQDEHWLATVAVYDNRFRDLIESRANLGIDPETRALVFQSVNRDRAHIRGIELAGRWEPGAVDAAGQWYLEGQASYGRGDDTVRHQPLNSVQPARATLAIGYDAEPRWGMRLALTGVARKHRVDQSAEPLYRPAGYARWDANLWWQPHERVAAYLTLGNLTDRRYYDWASLRGIGPDAPDLDLFTRPGRWASLEITLDW